jgi:hypothetical protein
MTTKSSSKNELTYSSEAPLANPSPSKESEKDSLTLGASSPLSFYDSLTSKNPDGSFGKMSPTSCVLTPDGRLEPSSGRWCNSGMGSLTECWTLAISESRRLDVVSTLSDILETGDLPPQCFLSPAACQGILNRAQDKRYKVKLSPRLRTALEKVASQSSPSTTKKDETSQNEKESPTL